MIWNDIDNNDSIDSRDLTYVGKYLSYLDGRLYQYAAVTKILPCWPAFDFTTGHTIENYRTRLYERAVEAEHEYDPGDGRQLLETRGRGITDMPRYYWNGDRGQANHIRGNPFLGNSTYYESGNFLAIREVTLSYTFPATLLERIGIANLRLHATGNNLHYFTRYKGLNPEQGGRDYGRYPIPRNIIFGANISF